MRAVVERAGVACGLGSDLAGGYACSILSAARAAVVSSKVRAQTLALARAARRGRGDAASGDAPSGEAEASGDAADGIDWRYALWLATRGGAQALALEGRVGGFDAGADFDALLVDAAAGDVLFTLDDGSAWTPRVEGPAALVERYVNLGDDRNVAAVWVRGREVHCRDDATARAPGATGDTAPDAKRARVAV